MALNKLSSIISSALQTEAILSSAQSGKAVRLDHYVGSTSSFLIREILKTQKNLLVVLPDFESAQFLKSDVEALGLSTPLLFPPTGQKPYDTDRVMDSATMVQRSEVLESINGKKTKVVFTSPDALFDKIASPESFAKASLKLDKGQEIDPQNLIEILVDQGYQHVKFVDEPGDLALRGGILDIFPYSGEYPVRLEFFGEEIDSIREFDINTQRSVSFQDSVRLVPNIQGLNGAEKQSLLTYFDENTTVILVNGPLVRDTLNELYHQAEHQKKQKENLAEPDSLFLSPVEFQSFVDSHGFIQIGGMGDVRGPDEHFTLDASPQPDFNGSIKILKSNLQDLSKMAIETYILCDSPGQRDRFEELLGEPNDNLRYHLSLETIHRGFVLKEIGIAVYTDHQIFNRYHRPKTKQRKFRGGITFKELKDLKIGDFVVHVDYGIGKFAGFKKIMVRGSEQEAVALRYQQDSILYVNVSSLHKVQKYSGKDGTEPKITKLGSGEWQRKKAKTKSRVKDIARDLIKLYAERKAKSAFAFAFDNAMQMEMEANFMFEETPDQMKAIEAVKSDMESSTPMDRLVCGDVGFGKTEVAVRAAFKAVMDGKQVAVLVPTTILADQHTKTFEERMGKFGVEVRCLNRFRSKEEIKNTLKRAKEGTVDVVIGTHRITSKDVQFKDLGLLIIDEEQRFGVATKEKIKALRATVDVLTMTATPIPRTLQFSLMGARDLSIINTPPPNRQPVTTQIHSFDTQLLRDAISQEISRGGQVFFIHNRVKNIEEVGEMIRQLVPEVRVKSAHGQMPGTTLEKIIYDFYHNKFDVLVSTNIVENGIDIANANTIIINNAHQFGLSELHQLRGRVGRSNRKAYCYLITPPMQALTMESRRRLMALEEFSDLGSGFNIAMRDLDIRGAGDILGAEQSGFISDIGFELYTKILNDAVKELKETEFKGMFDELPMDIDLPETVVEVDLPALLPAWYVEDSVERLNLYRRLASSKKMEEINDWEKEIEDRFGKLPNEATSLILASKIKLLASRLLIHKVIIRADRMWLQSPPSKSESEAAKEFYQNGGLQKMMAIMDAKAKGKYQLVQKDDAIRFVVQHIPDAKSALQFLEEISK